MTFLLFRISEHAMDEIALLLSNTRPPLAGGVPGCDYEHLFPDREPKWRFARLYETAPPLDEALKSVAGDASAVALKAEPLAARIGGPTPGPVALWVVLTNPVEGKEAEFNDWYDGRHVDDTLAIPGFVSGHRFKVTATAGGEPLPWRYLAFYEIELDRAAESLAEAAARAGGPKMPNPGYLAPGVGALPFKPVV